MTRTTTTVLVWAALLLLGYTCSIVAQQRTPVLVTRIYTGQDGQTHAENVDVKVTATSGERSVSDLVKTTGLRFVRLSPGVVQDWHTAPQLQYVVTISGQGEVEVAGGQKISLEPGPGSPGGRRDGQRSHHTHLGNAGLDSATSPCSDAVVVARHRDIPLANSCSKVTGSSRHLAVIQ